MTRKFLHFDLDAFFCSVEELSNPGLCGKAFAVGAPPEKRGVVASCSYPARKLGIHSAMPMHQAVRMCPSLIIVSPKHHLYEEKSHQVMAILRTCTPLIEQVSIDEAFLDLSDLPESLDVLAQNIHDRVLNELMLPNSIGGATNKLVAKIANDYGKAQKKSALPPNAITIIAAGEEAAFLAPLPVIALWGVGKKTAEKLHHKGVETIGQLAEIPEKTLQTWFGKMGGSMAQSAKGVDRSEIVCEHSIKSISNETTFEKNVTDPAILQKTLQTLSESVGKRLREAHMAGMTVCIKIRWADFTTISRQITTHTPIQQDKQIFELAHQLLIANWQAGQPIRLIGVGISGLCPPVIQLDLWDKTDEKQSHLQSALDALRDRYGRQIIQTANKIKKKPDL